MNHGYSSRAASPTPNAGGGQCRRLCLCCVSFFFFCLRIYAKPGQFMPKRAESGRNRLWIKPKFYFLKTLWKSKTHHFENLKQLKKKKKKKKKKKGNLSQFISTSFVISLSISLSPLSHSLTYNHSLRFSESLLCLTAQAISVSISISRSQAHWPSQAHSSILLSFSPSIILSHALLLILICVYYFIFFYKFFI